MQESISVAKVWHQSLTHMDLGFIEISLESLLVYNIKERKKRFPGQKGGRLSSKREKCALIKYRDNSIKSNLGEGYVYGLIILRVAELQHMWVKAQQMNDIARELIFSMPSLFFVLTGLLPHESNMKLCAYACVCEIVCFPLWVCASLSVSLSLSPSLSVSSHLFFSFEPASQHPWTIGQI